MHVGQRLKEQIGHVHKLCNHTEIEITACDFRELNIYHLLFNLAIDQKSEG